MTGPTRNLVAALEEAGPLTLQELSDRLQYAPRHVLKFISEARGAGAPIRCRAIPGEASVFEVEPE